MAALVVTANNLRALKRQVWNLFPEAKSSHITEALAAAVGYRTYASLQANLKQSNPNDPEITLLDERAFITRLKVLGVEQLNRHGIFDSLLLSEGEKILIDTTPPSAHDIEYRSLRGQAWRNMMVAAVNAGIEQKLFSLRPGDNRWPGESHVYHFTFGDSIPALGCVRDAGWDELCIYVALWPTEDGKRWIQAGGAKFLAGDAYAFGWLERRTGFWLQSNTTSVACRRNKLATVVGTIVKPKGFGDRGRFIM